MTKLKPNAEEKESKGIPFTVRIILFVAWIALMVVIVWFSHQTAEVSSEQSLEIGKLLCSLLVDGYNNLSEFTQLEKAMLIDKLVRKSAHFSEYALLGVLTLNASHLLIGSYLYRKRKPAIKIIVYILSALVWCFLFACTDEVHQYFIPGRYCSFLDVMLDTCGSLTGIMLFHILFRKKLLYLD